MHKWKFIQKLDYPTKHQNFRSQAKNFSQSMLNYEIWSSGGWWAIVIKGNANVKISKWLTCVTLAVLTFLF